MTSEFCMCPSYTYYGKKLITSSYEYHKSHYTSTKQTTNAKYVVSMTKSILYSVISLSIKIMAVDDISILW